MRKNAIIISVIIGLFLSVSGVLASDYSGKSNWEQLVQYVAEAGSGRFWYRAIVDKIGETNFEIDKVKIDIETLKTENVNLRNEDGVLRTEIANLRSEIYQLKSLGGGKITPITKNYYRHSDSQDVFETATNRHIGYEEAVAKNIWKDTQIIY